MGRFTGATLAWLASGYYYHESGFCSGYRDWYGFKKIYVITLLNRFVFPWIIMFIEAITSPGMLQNILIGEYGFLIKGIEWPFALVFPYVISFYAALALLEDSGYLPRLGILLDGLLNKIGLSGSFNYPFFTWLWVCDSGNHRNQSS